VVRSFPRTEVPVARNSLSESMKRSTAAIRITGPASTSVAGIKGRGQIKFSTTPRVITARSTSGGLSKPGNATSLEVVSVDLVIALLFSSAIDVDEAMRVELRECLHPREVLADLGPDPIGLLISHVLSSLALHIESSFHELG
jgi:hypothetical protein